MSETNGIAGTKQVAVFFKTEEYAKRFSNKVEMEEYGILDDIQQTEEGSLKATLTIDEDFLDKVDLLYRLYSKKDFAEKMQNGVDSKINSTVNTASESVIKPVTKIAARTAGSLLKGAAKLAFSTVFTVVNESATVFKDVKKDVSDSDELHDLKTTLNQNQGRKMQVL